MSKYTTIQLKKETHAILQQYCKEHGYKISGLIENMIKQRCTPSSNKNVLRVN